MWLCKWRYSKSIHRYWLRIRFKLAKCGYNLIFGSGDKVMVGAVASGAFDNDGYILMLYIQLMNFSR